MAIKKEAHSDDEMYFLDRIGLELGDRRRKKRMTQDKVIEELNKKDYKITRQQLSNIESGRGNLTLYEMSLLCTLYGVYIDDVIYNAFKTGNDEKKIYRQYKGIKPFENKMEDIIKRIENKDDKEFLSSIDAKVKDLYDMFRRGN